MSINLDPKFLYLIVNPVTRLGSITVLILTFFASISFCTCFDICTKCCHYSFTTELTMPSFVSVSVLYMKSNSFAISFTSPILFASTRMFRKLRVWGWKLNDVAISIVPIVPSQWSSPFDASQIRERLHRPLLLPEARLTIEAVKVEGDWGN